MKNKIKLFVLLILSISLVLFGCTSQPSTKDGTAVIIDKEDTGFPREVVDGLGNKVVIEKKPARIISGVPSITETLFALELNDNIIAVSEFCDYPIEALEKEKIGGYKTLNIERIIELNPDIFFIYGKGDEEGIALIEASGIPVARFEPESIQEILDTIISIGQMTGKESKAEEIVSVLTKKKDDILSKIEGREVLTVFYEIWNEPLMAAGPGSFMDELITLAGGINIASDAEGAYPIFSIEALVERNPQVYLIPASHVIDYYQMTEEEKNQRINELKSRPGYSQIDAIKNNRIYLLEPNIVSRPGVRIIEALELVAKAIHPDVF